jgi:hypothetical protein
MRIGKLATRLVIGGLFVGHGTQKLLADVRHASSSSASSTNAPSLPTSRSTRSL